MEEANHWGRWLLAARRERPGEAHPADKSDELTPRHTTPNQCRRRVSDFVRRLQSIAESQIDVGFGSWHGEEIAVVIAMSAVSHSTHRAFAP